MAEFLRNPSEGKSIAYKYNNIYIYYNNNKKNNNSNNNNNIAPLQRKE